MFLRHIIHRFVFRGDIQNIGNISDETIYDDIDKKLLQKVIKWVYIVNVFI